MAAKKSTRKKSTRKKSTSGTARAPARASRARCAGARKARCGARPGGRGGKVKSRKQAVAIGLSEARKKGAKVPRKKKSSRRKSST